MTLQVKEFFQIDRIDPEHGESDPFNFEPGIHYIIIEVEESGSPFVWIENESEMTVRIDINDPRIIFNISKLKHYRSPSLRSIHGVIKGKFYEYYRYNMWWCLVTVNRKWMFLDSYVFGKISNYGSIKRKVSNLP